MLCTNKVVDYQICKRKDHVYTCAYVHTHMQHHSYNRCTCTHRHIPYTYMHTYGLLVDQQSLLYQTHVCVCIIIKTVYVWDVYIHMRLCVLGWGWYNPLLEILCMQHSCSIQLSLTCTYYVYNHVFMHEFQHDYKHLCNLHVMGN